MAMAIMASSQTLITTLLIFFSLTPISYAAFKLPKPTAIHFPIRKNQTTHHYYTTSEFGTGNFTIIDSLIDLGAQSVWFECTSYLSPTYNPASCGSTRCKKAKLVTACIGCSSSSNNSSPARPGCSSSNNTCAVYGYNPFQDYLTPQELGEDTMQGVTSTDGRYVRFSYDIPKFQFSCAGPDIVDGLPGDHTRGLAGFGRTQASLPAQVSSAFKLARKFAICLPSSSEYGLGDVFIGGGPYYMPPSIEDQALSLVATPLVINPVSTAAIYSQGDASDEYFVLDILV